jgi:DNA-binding transcriptional LysR family regulator
MELSITQLRNFLHVVDIGSFRGAAERAHRSQPALSLSIKELELRLGQPLFERSTPTHLTPLALDCVPIVRDLVEHYDQACESLGRLASGRTGSLSVASVMTATTHWLSELVPEFVRKYPDVSIRLVDDNSANIEKLVLANSIDFGICSRLGDDDRLVFEPLNHDVFGLVCRHDHPLGRRTAIEWKSLDGLPLVGTTTHRSLRGHAQAAPLQRPAMYVENMTALLSLVDRGQSVTVLPALAVPPYATGLAFVPLKNPTIERVIGILSIRGRVLSPPAATLRAMLRSRLKAP